MTDANRIIQCSVSEPFVAWLAQAGGSVAITTYQAGKIVLVGWDGRQVTVLMRDFPRPMGLAVDGSRLVLATRDEVLLFANADLLAHDYLEPGKYDALFLPRGSYFAGNLNLHDVAFGEAGLWAVNTRFSCLSAFSMDYNFVPRWQPKFISELAPEDRCHLNGMALVDGHPRFVTALGETDEAGTWRENRAAGGVVIDVETRETVLHGLCMPHSPRWHEGRLWFLNSGTGELCVADTLHGSYDVVCSVPGYVRGLCFVDSYALIGLSGIRETHVFDGLPVQQRHRSLLCGVAVIDLLRGQEVGMLRFTSGAEELYDVQFLPSVFRPTILNREKEAARQAFTAPEFSYWMTPAQNSGTDGNSADRSAEDPHAQTPNG